MVVSKFIGETEKNLELLFARAENKKWILFFDEADALFGKRTNVRDAHDKYANQEVSYLLQRIEDYDGLVILATNMRNNIDEAFIRRFNSILKFSMPGPEERKKIWKKTFPAGAVFKEFLPEEKKQEDPKFDLFEIVKTYELSGGHIVNVVHYASIKALKRQEIQTLVHLRQMRSPSMLLTWSTASGMNWTKAVFPLISRIKIFAGPCTPAEEGLCLPT